jgi:hypothetical protein
MVVIRHGVYTGAINAVNQPLKPVHPVTLRLTAFQQQRVFIMQHIHLIIHTFQAYLVPHPHLVVIFVVVARLRTALRVGLMMALVRVTKKLMMRVVHWVEAPQTSA